MGNKKEKLIKEFVNKPYQVEDEVYVPIKVFRSYSTNDKNILCKIIGIDKDYVYVKITDSSLSSDKGTYTIDKTQIIGKNTYHIGVNPFPEKDWHSRLTTTQFSLDSILFRCGWDKRNRGLRTNNGEEFNPDEMNFNPYVIDKDGNKRYYQRDFVWGLKDKQLLIESIYNGINCGKIIVRERGFDYVLNEANKGNKEVAYRDIVDGKQRIGAILDFVNDKFCDLHGNYFSDFSNRAQHKFLNSDVLTYASLGENATDEDTIETFLMVNFTGKPMSRDHIDYVKKILNKI